MELAQVRKFHQQRRAGFVPEHQQPPKLSWRHDIDMTMQLDIIRDDHDTAKYDADWKAQLANQAPQATHEYAVHALITEAIRYRLQQPATPHYKNTVQGRPLQPREEEMLRKLRKTAKIAMQDTEKDRYQSMLRLIAEHQLFDIPTMSQSPRPSSCALPGVGDVGAPRPLSN